jgi:hypothetical protein
MALGYKYVERDASSYVNWASISKNMSDMLQEENRIREEKKAAIDEDSRQIGLTLANAPQGQDDNARKAALTLADNATQYKNMQLKLLKSGKLKLRDYLINTQNLKDTINQSFDALTEYQKNYGEVMDGYNKGTISRITVDNWAKTEGFGNWSQSGFYINPTNGIVNIGLKKKKIVDGKEVITMSEDMNDFASPNYIKGLLQNRVDRLDVQKIAKDWSSTLGTYLKVDAARSFASKVMKQGQIVSVDSIIERADYKQLPNNVQEEVYNFFRAETEWINSSLANPNARGSVLVDHAVSAPNGKLYRITNDKADADANPEAIYEEIDPSTQRGTLKFTKAQDERSNQFVRDMARSQYDIKEDIQVTAPISPKPEYEWQWQAWRDQKDKNKQNYALAENFINMTYGDAAQSSLGASNMSAITGLQFNKNTGGFEVIPYNDKGQQIKNKTVSFGFSKDGVKSTSQDFERSASAVAQSLGLDPDQFIKNVRLARQRKGFKDFNTTTTASGFQGGEGGAAGYNIQMTTPTAPAVGTGGASRFNQPR